MIRLLDHPDSPGDPFNVGAGFESSINDLARAIGYHKMVLSAMASNDAGIALYSRAGFSRVGVYREQGQLDGRWVDVVIMEKLV